MTSLVKKKHRFKSIDGAVRRVRELEKQLLEMRLLADKCYGESTILARLAATGAAFYNPLEAACAESIRDRILRERCRMNPDGSPFKKVTQ